MKRPAALAVLMFLLARASIAAADDKIIQLKKKLEARLAEVAAGLNGVFGLAIKDLESGDLFYINENLSFPQASSIKIAVLLELFKQAEEGRLKLDTIIRLERRLMTGGSGILKELGEGTVSLSLRDLAVLMVVLSDNTATNILIDTLGMERVNGRLAALGLKGTRLNRRMMDETAAARGYENVSTPYEMMRLLEMIYRGEALGKAQSEEVLEILSKEKRSPLRSGLPPGVKLANKPGGIPGVRCDSGIVLLPGRPYIISVMTTYLVKEEDGEEAISRASRLAYDYFSTLARSNIHGRWLRD